MEQQLSFLDPIEPRPVKYELFFVILPDSATAHHILELAERWRKEFGLTGKLRPPEILHVSLQGFGKYPDIPDALVLKASEAGQEAAAATSAFEVRFDQVLSYRRGGGNPLVLAAEKKANPELQSFYRCLNVALIMSLGRQLSHANSNPHLSLLYDNRIAPMKPISPVSWLATEVSLVASELGKTKYHHLGRWSFRQGL